MLNNKIEFAESFDATGFSADQLVGAYSQSQPVAPDSGNNFALRASPLFSFNDQGLENKVMARGPPPKAARQRLRKVPAPPGKGSLGVLSGPAVLLMGSAVP